MDVILFEVYRLFSARYDIRICNAGAPLIVVYNAPLTIDNSSLVACCVGKITLIILKRTNNKKPRNGITSKSGCENIIKKNDYY